MKRTTKDEIGGTILCIGIVVLLWLVFTVSGCSPVAPNAPNIRPIRLTQLATHEGGSRPFQPGNLSAITMRPLAGQCFDTTASVRAKLQWSGLGEQYKWEGYSCVRLGTLLLGTGTGYYPAHGAGIMVVRLAPDSVTVWGSIDTYVPEELYGYYVEIQVGTLLVSNEVRPIVRPTPLTCNGLLTEHCEIESDCEPQQLRWASDMPTMEPELPARLRQP